MLRLWGLPDLPIVTLALAFTFIAAAWSAFTTLQTRLMPERKPRPVTSAIFLFGAVAFLMIAILSLLLNES